MDKSFEVSKKTKGIIMTLMLSLFMTIHAQEFVDIEWNCTDTIVPVFSQVSDLPNDFQSYDYSLSIEYPETEPLSKSEILRYKVSKKDLQESFPLSVAVNSSRKHGVLDISVYPLAIKDGKIVKLLSFKPVISRKAKNHVTTRKSSSAPCDSSILSSGRWVKISVSKAGIYQLTKTSLSKMGFSNPSKVRLYGYGLEVLPETDIQDITDDLQEIPLWRKDDGTLLFYGCGTTKWSLTEKSTLPHAFTHRNNPYSTSICYFLTEADGSPLAFPVEEKVEGGEETTTFPDYQLIDDDEFSYIHSGRTFFDDYDFGGKSSVNYYLNLPGIADPKVLLNVRFSAAGSSTSALSVTANGKQMGTLSFGAMGEYLYGVIKEGSYTMTNAHEQKDTIKLTHSGVSGTAGHLDYIRASYTRKLCISDGYLLFRPSKSGALCYNLSGGKADTHVWRITSIGNTSEVPGTLSGDVYSATAGSSNWKNEKFVAVNTNSTFPEPSVIGQIQNQNLHSLKDVDLVIIVPANGLLTTEAQRLADAHTEHDKMKCVVVTADKVYNEFSSGTPDATAYRRFMKMLYDRNSNGKALNLCLFGDGVWDNRMQTSTMAGKLQDDYLLCYESDNSVSHTDSYVLEDYFALLEDGKGKKPAGEAPDCGIGRIPVSTASQAKGVVDKLIPYIYNKNAGAWRNTVCIMADDGNANVHMQDAEAVSDQTEKLFPDVRIRKIYWDSYTRQQSAVGNSYPDAYNDINSQMQEGALIMNYTGHGAAYCLSHEQVLKRADFENWSSPRLPMWVHAACDVTPFDMNEENIGETAIINPDGGAMGVLSTTRTVYSSQNRKMNLQFMRYALASSGGERAYTIGEALQLAKSHYSISSYRDSINRAHFVLLGDPAIRLASPSYKVVVDEFNGHAVTSEDDVIGAGSVVKVKGHIATNGQKAGSFTGTICPMVFDSEEEIECKNNAGDDITPFVFYSHDRILYSGTDSVRNGNFEFSFMVPIDISYKDANALISMYARSADSQLEANGRYSAFMLQGTSPVLQADTIGPAILLTLYNETFTNSDDSNHIVSAYASKAKPGEMTLTAHISDSNGINTTGSGIGHDMSLVIDNDPSLSYVLNNEFSYDIGSYSDGSLTFSLPELAAGTHTLVFRAWDILNNPAIVSVTFEVIEGYNNYAVFDTTGRELWSGKGTGYTTSLPRGVYILRSGAETKKILIK